MPTHICVFMRVAPSPTTGMGSNRSLSVRQFIDQEKHGRHQFIADNPDGSASFLNKKRFEDRSRDPYIFHTS